MTNPLAAGDGYALYHSIGLRPGGQEAMAGCLADFARIWSAPNGEAWGRLLPMLDEFRTAWARLLGRVNASEIALTPSVTASLMSLIDAVEKGRLRGRTVLIADDAFPSLHFLLQGLAGVAGFEIRRVARRQGAAWTESADFAASMDDGVGLALVTWVSSTSSAVSDLETIAANAPDDCLVVVDVTQGIGIVPLDLPPRIDAVVGSSLKWLCGTAGAGILWVRPECLDAMKPAFRGWFSQPNPMAWDIDRFQFAPDARRFENGTPSPLPYVASLPGLQWVLERGVDSLLAHNRALTNLLVEGLLEGGLCLATPADPARRGGSVMADLGTEEAAKEAVQRLAAVNVHTDSRSSVLRISPGTITTAEAIERCLDVLIS